MRRWAMVLAVSSAVIFGACSSSDSSETKHATEATQAPTTTVASDADAFCAGFTALAQQREEQGGGAVQRGSTEAVPDGKEGWDQRIATTQHLAATAPPDYQDEADTYVDLVEARAELFATFDYPQSLAEIPAEATQAFIADHIDEQQQANRFIAFAKDECGVA